MNETTTITYNENVGYELMAAIINSAQSGYEETAQEDITEILKLCYVYSVDAGGPKEFSASDLGEAILTYLGTSFNVPNFQDYARDYWRTTPVVEGDHG